MARCNDCNKFVSYEGDEEPEYQGDISFDYDKETGELTADFTVRRTLNCMECSTELKETTLEFIDIKLDLPKKLDKKNIVLNVETVPDEKSEGAGRYMKMFYGATATVTANLIDNTELAEEEFSEYCQASNFEECY